MNNASGLRASVLIDLLIVIGVLCGLAFYFLPKVKRMHAQAQRSELKRRLYEVHQMQNHYHSKYQSYAKSMKELGLDRPADDIKIKVEDASSFRFKVSGSVSGQMLNGCGKVWVIDEARRIKQSRAARC